MVHEIARHSIEQHTAAAVRDVFSCQIGRVEERWLTSYHLAVVSRARLYERAIYAELTSLPKSPIRRDEYTYGGQRTRLRAAWGGQRFLQIRGHHGLGETTSTRQAIHSFIQ